jgi:hypothetical protein
VREGRATRPGIPSQSRSPPLGRAVARQLGVCTDQFAFAEVPHQLAASPPEAPADRRKLRSLDPKGKGNQVLRALAVALVAADAGAALAGFATAADAKEPTLLGHAILPVGAHGRATKETAQRGCSRSLRPRGGNHGHSLSAVPARPAGPHGWP